MDYFLQNAATGHFQHGETPSVQHPGGALALPGGSPVCLAGVSTQITLLPEQAAGRAESVWMLPWHLLVLGIRWADLPPGRAHRNDITHPNANHNKCFYYYFHKL